jgi:hypothetical protein
MKAECGAACHPNYSNSISRRTMIQAEPGINSKTVFGEKKKKKNLKQKRVGEWASSRAPA